MGVSRELFEEVLVKKPDPLGKVPFMADPTAAAALAQIGRRLGGDERDGRKGRMRKDFDDFAVHTVKVYAGYVLKTMREFIPDKLIGSNLRQGGETGRRNLSLRRRDGQLRLSEPGGQRRAGLGCGGQ